jgi:hypothetical protein
MGLGLPDGGHLTHGYYVSIYSLVGEFDVDLLSQTAKKKMTASSIYFQSFPYAIDRTSHLIDYDGTLLVTLMLSNSPSARQVSPRRPRSSSPDFLSAARPRTRVTGTTPRSARSQTSTTRS